MASYKITKKISGYTYVLSHTGPDNLNALNWVPEVDKHYPYPKVTKPTAEGALAIAVTVGGQIEKVDA